MNDYVREKRELAQELNPYIKKELLKWQTKFPISFYKELFRLNGWNFTINEIKKRSNTIGTWVNELVYDELPNNILKELQEGIPLMEVGNELSDKNKLITRDIGNDHLKTQINQIITLFQLSDDMENMWDKFKRITNKQNNKPLESPFNFNEKGHSIEPVSYTHLTLPTKA